MSRDWSLREGPQKQAHVERRSGDSARAKFYRLKDEVFSSDRVALWHKMCAGELEWEERSVTLDEVKRELEERHGANLANFLRQQGIESIDDTFNEELARRHLPIGSALVERHLKEGSPMHLSVKLNLCMRALNANPNDEDAYTKAVTVLNKIRASMEPMP